MSGQSLNRALTVLICGVGLLAVAFGVRTTFGFFLKPMSGDMGWSISELFVAIAIQNLMWGAMQPFAGAWADKMGAAVVVLAGALLYGAGLVTIALSDSLFLFNTSMGLMLGTAQAALGFPVILGALARTTPESYRSLFLGIATAGGSFGQLIFAPVGQQLLEAVGWVTAFYILAGIAGAAAVLALGMLREVRSKKDQPSARANAEDLEGPQTLKEAFMVGMKHRGFLLLTAGFFVCGFQLAFITFSLPIFAGLCGLAPTVAATGLALIGGFNIIGSIGAGMMGKHMRQKYPLAWIYLGRTALAIMMVTFTVTDTVMYIFAVGMGLLWLSTIPLTSGVVARIFGPKYVGLLFGIVFFSHQLGSFAGLIISGYFYDLTGSFDVIWWASAAMGVFAALVHLPINDARVKIVKPKLVLGAGG